MDKECTNPKKFPAIKYEVTINNIKHKLVGMVDLVPYLVTTRPISRETNGMCLMTHWFKKIQYCLWILKILR